MPNAWPRPWHALLLLSGFAIPAIPLYHAYLTLQLEWADIGSIYDMLLNVFEDGRLLYYETGTDYQEVHFTPFLLSLALVLRALPTLPFLLVLHLIALVAGAFALFLVARDVTRSEVFAALLFFAFLVNPYTFAAILYPHFNVFMVPALLFFYYFLLKGRPVASLVCLVIALTIKEDVWLYALGLALTQIDRVKRPLIITTVAITSVYFIVGTQWLWPWLYPHRQDVFLQCFAQADTKVGVALYLLQHPFSTAAKLWTGPGLGFFSTILFLPFLAPLRSLCVLPMTYLWLNSTSPERSSLAFNNGVPTLVLFSAILPFGLQALGEGVARASRRLTIPAALRERLPGASQVLAASLLVGVGLLRNLWLPDGLEKSPNLKTVYEDAERRGDGVRDHHVTGWDILRHRMQPNTSVIADFNLMTYTRERHRTHGWHREWRALENGTLRPDYVLYHLKPRQPAIGPRRLRAIHEWMLANRNYRLVYAKDDYYLFERVGDGD